MPDNALMGKHIISHGNTGTVTAYADTVNHTIKEQTRTLPVTTFSYGSTTHIQANLLNVTDDGEFDVEMTNVLEALVNVAKEHHNIGIDVRYALSGDMEEELVDETKSHLQGNVNHLSLTNVKNQDALNVQKPFTSTPDVITFIIYPTNLPAPK